MDEFLTGIDKLNFEERRWLYLVIWRMILSDERVDEEEYSDLREAMRWVRKSEMEELERLAKSMDDDLPLEPLENLTADKAITLLMEIVRVAAIDGQLAIIEISIIEKVGKLLGFDESALKRVGVYAQQLTAAMAEKKDLSQILADHFTPPR